MTKLLDGLELAGFIKEKQAKQVRGLRQAHNIFPKLAIIQTLDNPVINKYIALKQRYGQDILVDVEHHKIDQPKAKELIHKVNNDSSVHGVILQLPLSDPTQTDELCEYVRASKDVDGLGNKSPYLTATPAAILWLLAAYNIELEDKKVVIVGRGKLVGAPLAKAMQKSGLNPEVVHTQTKDPKAVIATADILISAAGKPGLITADGLKVGAVGIDAGTANEGGAIAGDFAPEIYQRQDLTLTPAKGGIGPLTVAALFDNLIQAALASK